jgi:hypothetical protein
MQISEKSEKKDLFTTRQALVQGERFGTVKAIRVAGELVDAVGPGESA